MAIDWRIATIGEYFEFKNGLNKGKSFFGYGTPIVNYIDVYRGDRIRASNLKGRVHLSKEEIRRFEVKKGDVFFTRTSETPEEVGLANVMLDDVNDCVFSGFVLRARPKCDAFDIMYCKYCFSTDAVRKAIVSECTYTTRALTNGRQLSRIEIPLPEKGEQIAIAEALLDTDDLIASLQKLIAKKKALKQGAMQELLTGKRRLPGFSGEWVKKRIGDFTTVSAGGTPSTLRSEYWDGNIPWMSSGELHKKRIYDVSGRITQYGLDNSSTSWVPEHCVMVGLAGQGKTRGTVAISCIPLCTNQSIASIFPSKDKFSSEFLYQTLDNKYEELRELSTGDGGRGGLNLKLIKNLVLSWPTLEEQTAIAQVLSDMDAEIEQFEKKFYKYQQIKQGMMQELLTGRIRLVDAEPKQAQPAPAPPQKHNQQFDDAIMIAGIVDSFYSDKYPLGRKKVQKLLYLARRKEEADVSDFQKKAAGPYADAVRYKGGEPIAKKSDYVAAQTSGKGTMFSRGANIEQALGYIQSWGKQTSIDWLVSNFQHTRVDDLELFATVDMAVCDLREMHKPISVQTIKELIHSTEEWREKLDKTYFSDQDIQRAINKCRELFGEQ